jgi:hypothetical protein
MNKSAWEKHVNKVIKNKGEYSITINDRKFIIERSTSPFAGCRYEGYYDDDHAMTYCGETVTEVYQDAY